MLPAWIIDELIRREKERQERERLKPQPQLPLPESMVK